MNLAGVSNFSIDHILGSDVGRFSQPALDSVQNVGYLPNDYRWVPSGFTGHHWDYRSARPGARPPGQFDVVPTAVLDRAPCGVDFGNSLYLRYGFEPADFNFYPNSALQNVSNTGKNESFG